MDTTKKRQTIEQASKADHHTAVETAAINAKLFAVDQAEHSPGVPREERIHG